MSLLFPKDEYAAAADKNDDYPGSCGRCYDIRCVSGTIIDNDKPVQLIQGFFDGDMGRPYLADINPNYTDSFGRSYPGNPENASNQLYTKCWDESKTLRIRIADSCPCIQVLEEGAPSVKPGGEVRRQQWCCGGYSHFDISYYGFEQLAHPVYGVMMLDYKPVDCDTGAALPVLPGYISSTIFRDSPQPGWGLSPDKAQFFDFTEPRIAPDGSGGACVSIAPTGYLSFRCRECYKQGYQPFKDANKLSFWIKADSGSSSPFESSTPTGTLPGLKLFILNEERQEYCAAEPVLGQDVKSTRKSGDWYKIEMPVSLFECGGGKATDISQVDNLSFQNIAERNAVFCLADLKIV